MPDEQGISYIDLRADDDAESRQLAFDGPGFERAPALSPDGRLVAYVASGTVETGSGRREVYVRSFPDGEVMRQVSIDGGTQVRWSRDGAELYYVQGDTLMAVEVSNQDILTLGRPEELFSAPDLVAVSAPPSHDVFPDGESFVTVMPAGQASEPVTRIRIVENWFEEFRDREE